jgi:hypothetical protein
MMWGNALGWLISAVLIVVMGASVYIADRSGRISPPTNFSRDATNQPPMSLPIAPGTVLSPTSTLAPSSASAIYQQAIAECESNAKAYTAFVDRGHADDIAKLPALALLASASGAVPSKIFSDHPEKIVHMHPDSPALVAVRALGSSATRAALLVRDRDPKAAMNDGRGAFALGAALFDERLTRDELLAGLELMGDSSAVIKKLAQASHDVALDSKLAEFDSARLEFYEQRIKPMLRVLTAVDDNVIANYAGDVFYIAQRGPERVWRVEAIFALGRMKYFVGTNGRAGDQRGATRILARLANDPDPVIRAAATSARDLTIEEYRKQH